MTLVGREILDYSAGVPSPEQVRDAGFVGVIRYTSPPRANWMIGKPLGHQEAGAMFRSGLTVASNWQFGKGGNETSDWLRGRDGGLADAIKGIEIHTSAGGPGDAGLYASIDAAPTQQHWDALVRPYLEAWQDVVGRQRLGVYANPNIIQKCLDRGLATYFWEHGWGGDKNAPPHPAAHIKQHQIDVRVNGIPFGVDRSTIYKEDFGQWRSFADNPGGVHMGDPLWLADVLRAEGLNVIEHDGWRNRGHGDMRDVRGVMGHHTAGGGPNDWVIVQNGRPGLAGPLAQLVIEKDGSVRVIAVGVCHHAGNGSGSAWAGKFTADANWHVIGWEAVSKGTPPWDWTEPQLVSMRKVTAAILRHLGKGADWFCGHKEYNLRDGKIDPAGVDMNVFRNDVQWMIDNPPWAVGPGAIELCRNENPWLGDRMHDEMELVNPDQTGRRAHYQHGSIYWSPRTPAVPMTHDGMQFWGSLGHETSWLGYPLEAMVTTSDGSSQKFEKGTIWRKAGDTIWYPTTGGIHDNWMLAGGPSGALGWPQSREDMIGGKIVQQFEHGRIGWRMDPGPFIIIDNGERDELL